MRGSLSCECGRDRGRAGSGPVDCPGGATRARLGPRSLAAVGVAAGAGQRDGRGPGVAPAWLVATLLATRARRRSVSLFLDGLNIQDRGSLRERVVSLKTSVAGAAAS